MTEEPEDIEFNIVRFHRKYEIMARFDSFIEMFVTAIGWVGGGTAGVPFCCVLYGSNVSCCLLFCSVLF